MTRRWLFLGGLLLVALISLGVALAVGSVSLSPGRVAAALFGHGGGLDHTLVVQLRLPRALAAFGAGALLALAGALMQVLLRNPLADPYILGVSGGAAVGALLTMVAGLGVFWLQAGAFAGALGATLLVFALAHGRGGWTPTRLLLTGVVVASGFSALISLILSLGPDRSLRSMLFWLMGDLSYADSSAAMLLLPVGLLILLYPFARHLNVLARGETLAELLGVPVRPFKILIYLTASLATGLAVTLAGSIGFVGLVVPHMLRLAGGSDHRWVLPGSLLLGGSLVMLADTLARTVMAPMQLPVGVLLAMLGVPVFLYLLHRARGPL